MKARLVLEDGTIFQGVAFGAEVESGGEVVFNTGMTGYQEILTDPSYSGQIITLTYPLIGNYGINPFDHEAVRPWARGLVVKEHCPTPSNWRSQQTLDAFLIEHGIPGIAGIDTRTLTKKIRSGGALRGLITTSPMAAATLVAKAQGLPPLSGQDFVSQATTQRIYSEGQGAHHVVLLDCGAKGNIIKHLINQDCRVTVVPSHTTSEAIWELKPDGLMLSNGPGDPKDAGPAITTIKQLLGKLPIFGICLGHQLLALALGGDTYKMNFGHRGSNHPVQDLATGQVTITSQNHGYAVRADSLDPKQVAVSHLNLNDQTVEGLRHRHWPVFSVQYHPEAAPGPEDSAGLFTEFIGMMQSVVGVNC